MPIIVKRSAAPKSENLTAVALARKTQNEEFSAKLQELRKRKKELLELIQSKLPAGITAEFAPENSLRFAVRFMQDGKRINLGAFYNIHTAITAMVEARIRGFITALGTDFGENKLLAESLAKEEGIAVAEYNRKEQEATAAEILNRFGQTVERLRDEEDQSHGEKRNLSEILQEQAMIAKEEAALRNLETADRAKIIPRSGKDYLFWLLLNVPPHEMAIEGDLRILDEKEEPITIPRKIVEEFQKEILFAEEPAAAEAKKAALFELFGALVRGEESGDSPEESESAEANTETEANANANAE